LTTATSDRSRVKLKVLPAYADAFRFSGRYLFLFGGAGSGKSYSAASKLIIRCLRSPGERFLVVRKVYRTCRSSTFLLIKDILRKRNLLPLVSINETEMLIRFPNGSEIMHAGLDDVDKLKSLAEPTGIWIEEATETTEEDFVQLDLRIRGETPSYKQVMLSENPVSALHWTKARFIDDPLPDSLVVHTTYKDNPYAGTEYADVFARIRDEQLRAIYERGEWGYGIKGLVYTDWVSVPAVPERDHVYGIDFGYNKPSAIVRVSKRESDLWVEELLYERNLTNQDLIERMKQLIPDRSTPIYCDSAEPQRIEELYRAGFNAQSADKDVSKGIDSVKSYKLHVEQGSINLMNELRTYKWGEDKAGNLLDQPVKWMDHALDALRYGVHSAWGKGDTWLIN